MQLHIDQEALDWAEELRDSSEYKISQIMRRRIERLFGEAKEQMGLRRARRRGLEHMLNDRNGPKHQTHCQVIQS